MRISDWSSDVCSSDLALLPLVRRPDADSWSLILAARAAAELGRGMESTDYLGRAAELNPGEAVPFAIDHDYGLVAMAADAAPLDPAQVIPAIAADFASGNSARAIERAVRLRSEEHTSELQSLMRNTYAVFRLQQTKQKK